MTTRKAKAQGLPRGATLDVRDCLCEEGLRWDPPRQPHYHRGTHYACGRETCPDGPGPHFHERKKRRRILLDENG